jgi:hypothetical protein
MNVTVNSIALVIYLKNRVQEEEFIKLVTNLNAGQLELCAENGYPKRVDVELQGVACAEVLELLKKLEILPS